MITISLFSICIEICKKEFPERLWWEEDLPYICIRELCMRRERYDNGQLKLEGEIRDGKLEGIHRVWYESNNDSLGQLEYEGVYRDNKCEGIHRSWYGNQQLRFEGEYRGDKKVGIHRYWYTNGELGSM